MIYSDIASVSSILHVFKAHHVAILFPLLPFKSYLYCCPSQTYSTECRTCGQMKTVQLRLSGKLKKKQVQKKRNAYDQTFLTLPPGISQRWVTHDLVILAEFSALKLLCGGLWYHYTVGPFHTFLLSNSLFICFRWATRSLRFRTFRYTNAAVLDLTASLSASRDIAAPHCCQSDLLSLLYVCLLDKRAPLVSWHWHVWEM